MLLAQQKAGNICVKSFLSSGKGRAPPRAARGLKGLEAAGRRSGPRPGLHLPCGEHPHCVPPESPHRVTPSPSWEAAQLCSSGAPTATAPAPSDQPHRPSPAP